MPTRRTWIGATGDFGLAGNFSPTGPTVTGDTVDFTGASQVDVTSGLDQNALNNVTLNFHEGNEAKVGTYVSGVATYLKLGSGLTVNAKSANCERLMIWGSAGTMTANVDDSAENGDDEFTPPVLFLATTLVLDMSGGHVGVAIRSGEVTTATSRVVKGSGERAPKLVLGPGVTPTLIRASAVGGSVISHADQTHAAVQINAGEYISDGAGAHTLLTIGTDGRVYYDGLGLLGTFHNYGRLSIERDSRLKSFGSGYCYRGSELNLDNGRPDGLSVTGFIYTPDGTGDGRAKLIWPAGSKFGPVVAA